MYSWLTLGELIKDFPVCTARNLHFLAKPLNNSLWRLPGSSPQQLSATYSDQAHNSVVTGRLHIKILTYTEARYSIGYAKTPWRHRWVGWVKGLPLLYSCTFHSSFFSARSSFFAIMYTEQKLPHLKLLLYDHSGLPPSFIIHSTYQEK
jgi:hypothetical protein